MFFDRSTPFCDTNPQRKYPAKNRKGISVAIRTGLNEEENKHIIKTIEHYYGRDQIKFVEKDKDTFESTIYSLADFGSTDVRNDQNYLLNYFKGKYGTLPYIDFSRLFARAGREQSSLLAHASWETEE